MNKIRESGKSTNRNEITGPKILQSKGQSFTSSTQDVGLANANSSIILEAETKL